MEQLRGWVHQSELQMEQLTTIFAPPASDENGVNCGVRMKKYSWRDNYLSSVCHTFVVNKHPALVWIQLGSLTSLINVDSYIIASPLKLSPFLSCLHPMLQYNC